MSEAEVRLTRAQVREVDLRAIRDYHVPGIVLMENAARGATDVAWDMLRKPAGANPAARVTIVCGGGNNGGDGLAVARHLYNRNVNVSVVLAVDPQKYTGDAAINWRIAQAMGIDVRPAHHAQDRLNPQAADLVIDALFGTGLARAPLGESVGLIALMNQFDVPVLSIDLPSGLDCDTGAPFGPACARATKTVTFVAEKAGFANPAARQYTGQVVVADIGCPKQIIEEVLRDLPA